MMCSYVEGVSILLQIFYGADNSILHSPVWLASRPWLDLALALALALSLSRSLCDF